MVLFPNPFRLPHAARSENRGPHVRQPPVEPEAERRAEGGNGVRVEGGGAGAGGGEGGGAGGGVVKRRRSGLNYGTIHSFPCMPYEEFSAKCREEGGAGPASGVRCNRDMPGGFFRLTPSTLEGGDVLCSGSSSSSRGGSKPQFRGGKKAEESDEDGKELQSGGEVADEVCSVCLSNFVLRDVVRALPACGHAFHRDCIDSWLRQQASCPNCRADLKPLERPWVHRIVLEKFIPLSRVRAREGGPSDPSMPSEDVAKVFCSLSSSLKEHRDGLVEIEGELFRVRHMWEPHGPGTAA